MSLHSSVEEAAFLVDVRNNSPEYSALRDDWNSETPPSEWRARMKYDDKHKLIEL